MTPKEIEQIVSRYIRCGSGKEIIGTRAIAQSCPVASALDQHMRRTRAANGQIVHASACHNVVTLFIYRVPGDKCGPIMSFFESIETTERVSRFIALVDEGAKYQPLEITRNEARELWKQANADHWKVSSSRKQARL